MAMQKKVQASVGNSRDLTRESAAGGLLADRRGLLGDSFVAMLCASSGQTAAIGPRAEARTAFGRCIKRR